MKMKLNSIRWRFPITYAAIALLTAVVMGGTLLAVLRSYYIGQEQNYLQKNAVSIAGAITPILSQKTQGWTADQQQKFIADLSDHIALLAFLSQTRVRLANPEGMILVDTGTPGGKTAIRVAALPVPKSTGEALGSGPVAALPVPQSTVDQQALDQIKKLSQTPPDKNTVLSVQILPDGKTIAQFNKNNDNPSGNLQFFYRPSGQVDKALGQDLPPMAGLVSNIPVVGTMYGFELQNGTGQVQVRSSQMYKQAIQSPAGLLGTIVLSDGPAYGTDIVLGVARAWAIASLVAIFIAALAGWWISRRMSAPILALTEATGRMAEGDLSVRAQTRSRDELGALARSFNDMAGRVEEMVAALRRFAGDAAHELHTPLTALHTSLELVRSDPELTPSARASVEQAWVEALRLETLSRDLLDLSRLEGGQASSPPETLDLGALVREASEPYASQAEQRGISFTLEIPQGEKVMVTGQAGQLCRAVCNLLENALKFTPAGGEVEIALMQGGEEAVLAVTDSGIGIPAEDQPFVFNRFHRGRNVTAYPGSGLGLAIVKAVVERHGGEIGIESLSPGTRFVMRLKRT
jgi:signal transduction histidine kinase